MKTTMEQRQHNIILVFEDIEETACLLQKMLNGNGYEVTVARTEEDAILWARSLAPDLILMSLDLTPDRLLAVSHRIRERAAVCQDVSIVIFCVPTLPQGAEIEIEKNTYMIRPDNFDQLRELLHRLCYTASHC